MDYVNRLFTTLKQEYHATFGSSDIDFPDSALDCAKFDKVLLRALDKGAMQSTDSRRLGLYRSILNYRYKVRVQPTKQQINESQKAFLERNASCAEWAKKRARQGGDGLRGDLDYPGAFCPWFDEFTREWTIAHIARQLLQRRLAAYKEPATPSHGPGVAANSSKLEHNKFECLDRDVPRALWRFREFFSPTPAYYSEFAPLGTDSVCKLRTVPKDSRGPRLIAPHLVSQMWIQQGVLDRCVSLLTRQTRWYKYHIPSGQMVSTIQFDDQTVNASLAKYASATCMYDTLDLSDASDRIPWALVCWLLAGTPLLRDLSDCRARRIELLDGSTHKLHMHAPMGSATCFVVLSLVVWSIVSATILLARSQYGGSYQCAAPGQKAWGAPFTPYRRRGRAEQYIAPQDLDAVFVFGDDVVIPHGFFDTVVGALEAFNLKVNRDKSYSGEGAFRESCGCDAYKGAEITPLRLKVGGVSSVRDVLSLVGHRNLAFGRGYTGLWQACDRLIDIAACELGCRHLIAATTQTEFGSCLHFNDAASVRKWNREGGVLVRKNGKLQRREIRCLQLVPKSVNVRSDLDSRSRLFRGVLGRPVRSGWVGNDPRVAVVFIPWY